MPITVKRSDFRMIVEPDPEGASAFVTDDPQLLADADAGHFEFSGVVARVDVHIPAPHDPNDSIIHTVSSPGCWGIATDRRRPNARRGRTYLREVYREECAVLEDMLMALGCEVVD